MRASCLCFTSEFFCWGGGGEGFAHVLLQFSMFFAFEGFVYVLLQFCFFGLRVLLMVCFSVVNFLGGGV